MGIEIPPSSLSSAERLRRLKEFDDAVSGIPTMTHASVDAREIRHMNAEELSTQLAASTELPDGVDEGLAADTLLAMMRHPWNEASPRSRGLMINFTQRILDEMGLKVARKDG